MSETGGASGRKADGSHDVIAARFLAGCDGTHSRVREKLQITFKGGTYENIFYVADVQATGAGANGEAWIALDNAEFLVAIPDGHDDRMRLIGPSRQPDLSALDKLSFNDVSQRVITQLGLEINTVNWFSTYRVHHQAGLPENSLFLLRPDAILRWYH